MSEHTPGPWVRGEATFFRPPEAGAQVIVVAAKGTEGRDPGEPFFVCVTGKLSDPPHHIERSWADALLIAAAPDLLEALESVEFTLEEDPDDPEWTESVRRARAAIAKAKGGTP